MAKNPVVHFEMPYKDGKRVADFYSKALGWNMQQMGENMGNYIVAVTSEAGENQRPKNPGQINGGFFQRSEDNNLPSVVIAVEDIEAAMKNIENAGGKILRQPEEIPGIGNWAVFEDTEGNRVSILKPNPMSESQKTT